MSSHSSYEYLKLIVCYSYALCLIFLSFQAGASDEDRQQLDEERLRDEALVRNATRNLIDEHIPKVANLLQCYHRDTKETLKGSERREFFVWWLPVMAHFYGINLRFLGILRNHMTISNEVVPSASINNHA